ncbi:cation diffusion facilitator family transporter [soil metagenome]
MYAAIAANVVIATTKFVAAWISSSSALFSEGLHSLVDSGDGLLLLLGMHLSRRAANARHPYGHGGEVYFWSMIVAMSIFVMGGGVSIYEGIIHLEEPMVPTNTLVSYGVLAAAFLFEGISLVISLRGFRAERGKRGVWETIERSKDPTTFVVVLEDSAALVGILVAATGVTLAVWFDAAIFDAIASIVIGVVLLGVGFVLGRETRSLLLGESASREMVASIRSIARAQPGVRDAQCPRTMHIGPRFVHVDLDVDIDGSSSGVDVSRRIEEAVRAKHPQVHRVSIRFPG